MLRVPLVVAVLLNFVTVGFADSKSNAAGEYAKHLAALKDLSVAVAEAMPPEHWDFRPHPESMTFGVLMTHIATTNYQFCAGLKDTAAPQLPQATDKGAVVKLLSDSFDYCTGVLDSVTSAQMESVHNSPDGRLPGREVLLAMYIHVAHHRGQAEIYLRDNGIKPPGYRI